MYKGCSTATCGSKKFLEIERKENKRERKRIDALKTGCFEPSSFRDIRFSEMRAKPREKRVNYVKPRKIAKHLNQENGNVKVYHSEISLLWTYTRLSSKLIRKFLGRATFHFSEYPSSFFYDFHRPANNVVFCILKMNRILPSGYFTCAISRESFYFSRFRILTDLATKSLDAG